MYEIVRAFEQLTPFETDRNKIRIGPRRDGGYVFLDMLEPTQTVLSYGISDQYDFDETMARAGHKVFMFDHTIGGIEQRHENMIFAQEGVAAFSQPGARLFSVCDHLRRNRIEGDRLILKMDVEGAEFDVLDAMPESTLARFEQLTIEFHFLGLLHEVAYRERFVRVFRKLNRLFTLFHVHANNHDGPDTFAFVGGLPIAHLMELSFVRTSVVMRSPNRTLYPTFLDYPNVGGLDKRLWIYPFLPTIDVGLEARGASWERTQSSSASGA